MRIFMRVLYFAVAILLTTSSTSADEMLDRALFQAVKIGHVDRVALLLEQGANAAARDESGKTPLMYAVERSGIDIISALGEGLHNTRFVQPRKPSLYQTSAAYDRIAKMLLESNPRNTVQKQPLSNLEEAFIAAVISGDGNQVRNLLAQGANPNTTDRGRSALIWAAFWNHTQVAQLLLGAGADHNQRDSNGFTALMWATERGYTEMVNLLQRQN